MPETPVSVRVISISNYSLVSQQISAYLPWVYPVLYPAWMDKSDLMARKAGTITGKLSAAKVTGATKPGMLNDGAGLYLKIDEGGSKSWILRFKVDGRSRKFGPRADAVDRLGTGHERKPPTRAACYSTVLIRSKRGRRPKPPRRLKPRA